MGVVVLGHLASGHPSRFRITANLKWRRTAPARPEKCRQGERAVGRFFPNGDAEGSL